MALVSKNNGGGGSFVVKNNGGGGAMRSKIATQAISDIELSGLVLHLDAGNAASYPGSGATWYDISGNGKHATLYNSPTYSSNNGGTLNFTPSGLQYAQGPAIDTLPSFTATCWVNFNSLPGYSYNPIMTDMYNTGYSPSYGINWMIVFQEGPNHLRGGFYEEFVSGMHLTPGGSDYYPSTGVWYNFATSFDDASKTVKFYVNGSLFSSTTVASNISTNASRLGYRIAKIWLGDGGHVDGIIPKVAVYNRALSDSEILGNYNAISSRFA